MVLVALARGAWHTVECVAAARGRERWKEGARPRLLT